jgi:hypothetical protein
MAKFFHDNAAFKGKAGRYVGSSSCGVPYFKRYVKPYDPKTPAQTGVRSAFKRITDVAQTINYGVLRPYTFPRPRKWSAYDHMTKINAPLLNAGEWDPAALKILDGPLYNPGIKTAEIILTRTRAAVYVAFDSGAGADKSGGPADAACLVVNDERADMTYYAIGTRRKGALNVAIAPIGLPPDFSQVYAYLCFAREPDDFPTGAEGENSATAFARAVLASDPLTQALAK